MLGKLLLLTPKSSHGYPAISSRTLALRGGYYQQLHGPFTIIQANKDGQTPDVPHLMKKNRPSPFHCPCPLCHHRGRQNLCSFCLPPFNSRSLLISINLSRNGLPRSRSITRWNHYGRFLFLSPRWNSDSPIWAFSSHSRSRSIRASSTSSPITAFLTASSLDRSLDLPEISISIYITAPF